MLRREKQAPAQRTWERILVPALERPFSMRCLEVAYRLAQDSPAVVQLAFVLEVPRSLALEALLPEEELAASAALQVAQQAAIPFKVQTEPFVHRARSAREGILHLITQRKSDLLVLGSRHDRDRGLSDELIRDLFRSAPCEVVLDYVAGDK